MKVFRNNLISFLLGGGLCLTACFCIGFNDADKANEEQPVVSAFTVSPEIPKHIRFCGENLDLKRYNMREGFDRELSSLTYFHSSTMLLIKRANRYFPIIEPILKKNGIPEDFKYMAVIESSLDTRATSPSRAAGIWQLLEGTAKQYGLTVTETVDERRHVEKSTQAACEYLLDGYKRYKNWTTVAASYNAGMGRISGELSKQYVDDSMDLWLVEETTRYVFRIVALKQIFEHPYKYGFVLHAEDLYKPIETEEVVVSSDIPDLAAFAKEKEITFADLKRLNTWLTDRSLETKGKTFSIQIPKAEELFYNKPNHYVHDKRWVVD
ncbi:lytic transglycosylase domain-containing protein [Parabacteroides sp. Marseille-P3160]|uniref:lytic transglycosylase domain-containing protein n=1 Tax=Parabacteroides sp. Marseille-P3160 TaxID=1917887 RepID=UPI0009BBDD74|nr:lytic transglycosylase domain-containing protein [Parabacteroides sp. Marseille-P3160]